MGTLKILNKKEIKPIFEFIKDHWNIDDLSFLDDYGFLLNDKDNIYIAKREIFDLDLSSLRINTIGLYFGEVKNEEFRLSIEGSQMIGKYAKDNVLELTREESRDWLRGYDLDKESELKGFVLVKYNDDFMGTGRIKEGRVLNFVPKSRRLKSSD
jgi:NOL1/NOP2/fmu family ribosome biogenesis protein